MFRRAIVFLFRARKHWNCHFVLAFSVVSNRSEFKIERDKSRRSVNRTETWMGKALHILIRVDSFAQKSSVHFHFRLARLDRVRFFGQSLLNLIGSHHCLHSWLSPWSPFSCDGTERKKSNHEIAPNLADSPIYGSRTDCAPTAVCILLCRIETESRCARFWFFSPFNLISPHLVHLYN